MKRILRRSSSWRAVTLLALVSMLSGVWLSVVHDSLGDETACALESGLPVGHPGAAVGREAGGVQIHHCYVCDWLRSLRSVTGHVPPALAAIAPAGFVSQVPITSRGCSPHAHVPARSPPA